MPLKAVVSRFGTQGVATIKSVTVDVLDNDEKIGEQWIMPTAVTNQEQLESTSPLAAAARQEEFNRAERAISLTLHKRVLHIGSSFQANVKTQPRIFRVVSLDLHELEQDKEEESPRDRELENSDDDDLEGKTDAELALEQEILEQKFLLANMPPVGILDLERSTITIRCPPPCDQPDPFSCGPHTKAKELSEYILDSFRNVEVYKRLNLVNKKTAMISGVAGSGKLTMARAGCRLANARMLTLDLAAAVLEQEILESNQAAEMSSIRRVFDRALQLAPSAVVIQNLDILSKGQQQLLDSQVVSTVVGLLAKEMERASTASEVFVLGLTKSRSNLQERFSRSELFQHEISIEIPIQATRHAILQDYVHEPQPSQGSTDSLLSRVTLMSSGYVAKDLQKLQRTALLHALRRTTKPAVDECVNQIAWQLEQTSLSDQATITSTVNSVQDLQEDLSSLSIKDTKPQNNTTIHRSLNWEDYQYALATSTPSQQIEFESMNTLAQSSFQSERRKLSWNGIGGYATIKQRIRQAVQWPISHPETFTRMGVSPPMGLLLYGPSGTGKTMMVQALAAETSLNFIPVKAPEIFSKYLGETEATLRRLFAMARQIAPCILFFDEMDSIGAKRGWGGDDDGDSGSGGSGGINERVLSTLLNEMDGVEGRRGVFVIGCTNQPQQMDDALLRPGRLDQLIYVGYPSFGDRLQILETMGKRIPFSSDSVFKTELAHATVGFSPADLEAMLREAAIGSLRLDMGVARVVDEEIWQTVEKMKKSVQDRVLKKIDGAVIDEIGPLEVTDVVVPDLYRRFLQDR